MFYDNPQTLIVTRGLPSAGKVRHPARVFRFGIQPQEGRPPLVSIPNRQVDRLDWMALDADQAECDGG